MRTLLALACVVLLAACGHKPLSEQPGYHKAHYAAQLYCSMAVNASLYSDEMARCVREQTIANMKDAKP